MSRLKVRTRWSSKLMVLGILIASTFSTLTILSSNTYALTRQECFDKYNGQASVDKSGGLGTNPKQLTLEANCSEYCKDATGKGAGINTRKWVCQDRDPGNAQIDNVVNQSNASELSIVIAQVCGQPAPGKVYENCANDVASKLSACQNAGGGGVTGSLTATPQQKAQCIKNSYNSIDQNQLEQKLTANVAAKDAGVTQVIKVATKKECEDKNGTYDEGTNACTIKPDPNGANCPIEGLGWFICPALKFVSNITDSAFELLAKMLTINIAEKNGTGALYKTWLLVVSVANAMFAIVLLVVIYSQLTGMGISNYGLKVIFPRLILGAILINTSYWICQLLIDISNVIGVSSYAVFRNAGDAVLGGTGGTDGNALGDLAWTTTLGVALVGSVVFALSNVAIILPLLGSALLAVLGTLLALTLRQALVVILLVLSPLAFAVRILPNTDGLFKVWWKLFKVVLLIFPAFGAVYGLSNLAGRVIHASDPGNLFMSIIALGVSAMGLFAIPTLMSGVSDIMKKALNSTPAGKVADKAMARLKSKGEEIDNMTSAAALSGSYGPKGLIGRMGGAHKKARQALRRQTATNSQAQAAANYQSNLMSGSGVGGMYGRAMVNAGLTKGAKNQLKASTASAQVQQKEQNIKNKADEIMSKGIGNTKTEKATTAFNKFKQNKDIDGMLAALDIMEGDGYAGAEKMQELIGDPSKFTDEENNAINQRIASNYGSTKDKDHRIAQRAKGESGETLNLNGLSPARLAGQSAKALRSAESSDNAEQRRDLALRALSDASATRDMNDETYQILKSWSEHASATSNPTVNTSTPLGYTSAEQVFQAPATQPSSKPGRGGDFVVAPPSAPMSPPNPAERVDMSPPMQPPDPNTRVDGSAPETVWTATNNIKDQSN